MCVVSTVSDDSADRNGKTRKKHARAARPGTETVTISL
ncbi:hypothetical protein FTUN_4568 [Frigoriglobus tundricola]|uniref:Uncharacterized protein n=1 Tax=Frigoriglobus tundricola TaxID=2774151 RepID=A0A6M5YSN1_9BACT|nr:hypothetical protein FTUN_4568 [Frigoriglobus tundricola]